MHLNLVKVGEDDDGAGGNPNVTQAQADQLRAAFAEVKGDPVRFLKFMMVDSFEDIPARDFPRALQFIEQKRRSSQTKTQREPGEEG
jgi:hypothetical protein